VTRINLLPPERIKERKKGIGPQRNYLWLVIALPLLILVLMVVWWFSMSSDMNRKTEALDQANKELSDIQAKSASLQKYQERQNQINQIQTTVVQALSGRIYWARILNNIAITCPTNIWLTSIDASSSVTAGTAAGSVTFDGDATQCPNRLLPGFSPGMLDYHPDFRPIAGWLERMAQIEQFQRVWLTTCVPDFIGAAPTGVEPGSYVTSPTGTYVIRFSSTATINVAKATVGSTTKAATSSTGTSSGGSSSSSASSSTGGSQ
jgi:Tfp pilus assembly protein PilN